METQVTRALVSLSIILSVIGIIMIFSATRHDIEVSTPRYLLQVMWFVLGVGMMFIIAFLPLRIIQAMTVPLFIVVLILLVVVLSYDSVKGSSRWIRLGFISLQPSELGKVSVLLMLAHYLSQIRGDFRKPSIIAISGFITGFPALFILLQPDLGTSIVFATIFSGLLFRMGLTISQLLLMISPVLGVMIGVLSDFNWILWSLFILAIAFVMYVKWPPRYVTAILIIAHLSVGLGAEPMWDSLHDYQQQRIETFLNPQADPQGTGYQIIQSKVAIGSGGLFGRGFLEGSQTNLAFLPEQHTDFIFSVIAEEFGFIGSIIILGMYYTFILIGIYIAMNVKSRYQSLIATGCVTIFAFHVLTNIAMVVGLLPIAGVPLPFLSYGGSFLLTSLILCGLLMNVWRNRFDY